MKSCTVKVLQMNVHKGMGRLHTWLIQFYPFRRAAYSFRILGLMARDFYSKTPFITTLQVSKGLTTCTQMLETGTNGYMGMDRHIRGKWYVD